jgi:hypothetical protein
MAIATQPPNPDVLRDRERDRERLRKVTPPDRRRLEQSQVNGTKTYEPHPALDECPRSLEDSHRLLKYSQVDGFDGEGEGGPVQLYQQTPLRRGIWDWSKGGTGRLNVIGRIPETQDDFGLPSTTVSEKNDLPEHEQVAASKVTASKVTVFGLSHSHIIPSPSFSQTKRSSDELVAASSANTTPATATPATLNHSVERWTNGKQVSQQQQQQQQTILEHSPPLTPETPTPPQRRRDTPVQDDDTPSKDATANDHAEAAKDSANAASPAKSPTAQAPGSHQVRTYKIALAPNIISPARSSTSTSSTVK